MDIDKLLKSLDKQNLTIGAVGSHSALDICRGAKDLGFKTLVIVEKGRDLTYAKYYKTNGVLGCVDEVFYVDKFKDLLKPEIQKQLQEKNVIFIPHRSFQVYLDFDYQKIENEFNVLMFGNRNLLKIEERGTKPNQYDLMDKAGIRYPKRFNIPGEIDRLIMVKVNEKDRKFERAFFLVSSADEFAKQSENLIKNGKITKDDLNKAVIEEFVIGVQVNFNFFYSPINDRLEIIGTDTRRQTNLEGLNKIPAPMQQEVLDKVDLKYEEAGHIAVTVLESLLDQAFELGERFVEASKQFSNPGVIGPFALQAIITPGPPKKDIVVVDISPRMPGSPGIAASPYSRYLFGESLSMGKRVAMEIKDAIESNNLEKILT